MAATFDLKEMVNRTQKTMAEDMVRMLYAPNPLLDALLVRSKPPSTWDRVKSFFGRARDAWLVLTGKLDPYDGW